MAFPVLLVEVSTDGSAWEPRPSATPQGMVVDGLPAIVGSCIVVEHLPGPGLAYLGDGTLVNAADPIPLRQHIRILERTGFDGDGAPETVTRWQGTVIDMEPNIDGSERLYVCREYGFLFGQYRAPAGLVRNIVADEDPDPKSYVLAEWPVFNPGGHGNRSPATISIAETDVYQIDAGSGTSWTAGDVAAVWIAQLNAAMQAIQATAIPVVLSVGADATGARDRVDEWDTRGLSLFQVLGLLFTGWCSWRIVPGDAAITVQLGDTATHALDAATRTVRVQNYNSGARRRCDVVEVCSTERPVCTLTLMANNDNTGSLAHDWTAEEASDHWYDPTNPALAHVFTRFRLAADWNGQSHDGTEASDGLRSVVDDNETRAWSASASMPKPEHLEVVPGAAVIAGGLAVLTAPGVWLGDADITEHCTVTVDHDERGPLIEIIYQPPGGSSGATAVNIALQQGSPLCLTIGVYEPSHRIARWTDPASVGAVPHTVRLRQAAREWYVAPGARLRETWDGIFVGTIIDEGDLVGQRDWLVDERYGPDAPAASFEVVIEGLTDTDALPAPGDLLTVANTVHGVIGPARVLERHLIYNDPTQACRLVCGRDGLQIDMVIA